MKLLPARLHRRNTVSFLYRFDGKTRRIHLSPARPVVVLSVHRPTDEGFESFWAHLELVGREIVSRYAYDGRDCDGRVSGGSESVCRVGERAMMIPGCRKGERDRRRFPRWRELSVVGFDYAAEAAGY